MDVSMNAHGVAVERQLGRPIMCRCTWLERGGFSRGSVAIVAAAGIDPR